MKFKTNDKIEYTTTDRYGKQVKRTATVQRVFKITDQYSIEAWSHENGNMQLIFSKSNNVKIIKR